MLRLCVGRYTSLPEPPGIQVFDVDLSSGKARLLCGQSESKNPSFLAFDHRNLYAVNEVMEGSCVDTYLWSRDYDEIRHVGRLAVPGSAMCHICLWHNKKYLSVSNYMSGSFALCALEENGLPNGIVRLIQYDGAGFDARGRQESAHVHSTTLSPSGDVLFAADLGLDRLCVYPTSVSGGVLPDCIETISSQPGDGPRHMTFSQRQSCYYLLTEMGNRIYVFHYDRAARKSRNIQTVSTLAAGTSDKNMAADIQIAKDGRFLYASNRGQDNLTGYQIDPNSGTLKEIGCFPLAGKGPRTFTISENGCLVAIACQESGDVLVYRRDNETGRIGQLLERIPVPSAAFVGFFQP